MGSCRACGRENRIGRKFCAGCGASLLAGCPGCGAANEPDERFCGECGTDLSALAAPATGADPATARPAAATAWQPAQPPVAERRLVSILFADLVGFTPFAAARDAEDVRETLTRYFDLASEVITRYGGTVEKFIGDAVMAVWGAPTTHEDDAERAVRAAIDLVDAVRTLGPTIQARAGVLTGEAAVTLGATNQGMVAGDLVNTAARLQSVARPGTVLVGEPTMRATNLGIAYEPAGEQELKGKAAPVPAWRALRVVAEVGGRNRAEGLEAPFVGRDDEMRQLKDLFHASARDRRVRLVSVVGPAGIGKSRLAWEFLKYIDGLVDTIWWHQGRSPAYGTGIAFWALGEMIRERCGLAEHDDERTTRARVAATVAEHIADPEERRWIEPALLTLLGVGDKGASSDQLFAAWRTFFERMAATAPVVMLFEDLHWADAGTLDFIDHVLEWTRDLPITILTLTRPELLDRRPDWGAGKRYFLGLFLEPLGPDSMHALLAGLVPGLPERAVRSIVARADGIPLYAVETVRMLLADGRLQRTETGYVPVGDLSDLAVPESLTALIASRLDALEPTDRSLLQDAAVLGLSFTPASLSALVDMPADVLEPRLRALVRREILALEADPRSPERGQYAFVQALIREVAYNTLAKRDRRAKHLAAARWFESLGSDELAGALARHYLAAWQNSPEGPEADALAGQARLALKAAADRSLALHAHEQAIALLTEAAGVAADPLERSDLLTVAARSLSLLGRYAEEERVASEARDLAVAGGAVAAEARATRWLISSLNAQLQRQRVRPLLEETLARAASAGLEADPDVLRLQRTLASTVAFAGDRESSLRILDGALVAAERIGDRALVLELLSAKGTQLCETGRSVEGLVLLDAVVRLAPGVGRDDLAADSRANLVAYSMDHEPRAALEGAKALIDLGHRTSDRSLVVLNVVNGAEIALRIGEWAWAESNLTAILRDDIDPHDRLVLLEPMTNLGVLRGDDVSALLREAEALAGDATDGLEMLQDRRATLAMVQGRHAEAAALWRAYGKRSPLNATIVYYKAGRMALWEGDLARARDDVDAVVATSQHGASIAASITTLQAGIAALEGRAADARRGYREAMAAWRDVGLPWDEGLAALDLVILLGPDDPDAATSTDRAREIFAQLGARPLLDRLDAAFAAGASTVGDAAMSSAARLHVSSGRAQVAETG